MRRLAERVLRPVAAEGAPGAWHRALRAMALDDRCLDVADEAAHPEFFGNPGDSERVPSRGQGAFPQPLPLGPASCLRQQGPASPTQHRYRLVTNLPDPDQAPALGMAALCHERREIEGVFNAFKTHPRANSIVRRSKRPDPVWQELWGLLLARGRCVSSCGRFHPRGAKRKMSNFNDRHRGQPLHLRRQPTPVLRSWTAWG